MRSDGSDGLITSLSKRRHSRLPGLRRSAKGSNGVVPQAKKRKKSAAAFILYLIPSVSAVTELIHAVVRPSFTGA